MRKSANRLTGHFIAVLLSLAYSAVIGFVALLLAYGFAWVGRYFFGDSPPIIFQIVEAFSTLEALVAFTVMFITSLREHTESPEENKENGKPK